MLKNRIARIENQFIEEYRYDLSLRQHKTFLHLVANLNPKDAKFHIQSIPVKEIEYVLKEDKSRKWGGAGGINGAIVSFIREMAKTSFLITSKYFVDGVNIPGARPMFNKIDPDVDENGELVLTFQFSDYMKPFLLDLREYVNIDAQEMEKVHCSHTLHLYQILKVPYQRERKHKAIVYHTKTIQDLREKLSLEDKYLKFKAFNQHVLKKATQEINDKTRIHVEYKVIRKGRKAHEIEFAIRAASGTQMKLELDTELTPSEHKRNVQKKREAFNYDQFKKRYYRIYKEKKQVIENTFKGRNATNFAIEQSLKNACEQWFVENT